MNYLYKIILKKMLEMSSQFLSAEQPSEPKSLDVALNIAGVKKYARKTCHSIQVLNERSVSEGGNLCPVVGGSQISLI